MTTEEKFHAAVNVIRSLPKNGSYQPSNDMMLRFYGYFKQATQGPCSGSRPAFWDIVGRAKYDAWKKMGSMTKNEAMAKYVNELHQIVETMSYSDNVASFLDAPSNQIENINMADLQLIVGDVIERVRSQPNSPFGSREASPQRSASSLNNSPTPTLSNQTIYVDTDEHSDGEYVDTIEAPVDLKRSSLSNGHVVSETNYSELNGHVSTPHVHKSRTKTKSRGGTNVVDISVEVTQAVQAMRMDLNSLDHRVTVLEKHYNTIMSDGKRRRRAGAFGLSSKLLMFIIVWPIFVHFALSRVGRRK